MLVHSGWSRYAYKAYYLDLFDNSKFSNLMNVTGFCASRIYC